MRLSENEMIKTACIRIGVQTERRRRIVKGKHRVKFLSVLLVAAMAFSLNGIPQIASAAGKTPKLSTKKVSVVVKKSETVKIKNKPSGAKVTWKSKDKKIAKVSNKGKITGVRQGKTTVTAKLSYKKKGKSVKKTFSVKVTVTKAAAGKTAVPATKAPQAEITSQPPVSTEESPSESPSGSGDPVGSQGPQATGTALPKGTPFVVPSAEPSVIPFKLPEDIDMTDPSVGVRDVSTVTDAEVTADTTNLGTLHRSRHGVHDVKDNGMMRKQLKGQQLTRFMGQGWNLSNTLESCAIAGAKTPIEFETGWGAIETTKDIIRGVQASGFNTIRIPVAWSNMVSNDGTYTIDTAYLTRVEQVVSWCLNEEMYVIIDIHYDGDWWGQFGYNHQVVRDEAWKRYERYWTQIAEWFKEYSDRLIFESANEEIGDRLNDDFINAKTGEENFIGTLTQEQCYLITNALNQKFVETVRKTGGNNLYRQLTVAGYNTDVDKTTDSRFVMPTDTVASNGTDKINVSIHYYTPSGYCSVEDRTDANYDDSWGTSRDKTEMRNQFAKMDKFIDAGYGVIISEYGPQLMSKQGIPAFFREVMTLAEEYNYAPIVWNTSMYNRTDRLFEYVDLAEVFDPVTGGEMLLEEGPDKTGTLGVTVVDESSTIKLATWEGRWTRTNNMGVVLGDDELPVKDDKGSFIPVDGELGGFFTTKCDESLSVVSNGWWWQLFLSYNWDNVRQPCIRLTLEEDPISKKADFQLGYTTVADGGSYTLTNIPNADYGSKVLTLKLNKLEIKPWLAISSSSPGATIRKIELFDLQ